MISKKTKIKGRPMPNNKKSGLLAFTLFILALSGCTSMKNRGAHPFTNIYPAKNGGTVIQFHGGGDIGSVKRLIDSLPKPIQIKDGYKPSCHSACTYAFRYTDTCVSPDAHITFHAGYNRNRTINYEATIKFLNYLPFRMREYFKAKMLPHGRYMKLEKRIDFRLRGHHLHDMFGVPYCD